MSLFIRLKLPLRMLHCLCPPPQFRAPFQHHSNGLQLNTTSNKRSALLGLRNLRRELISAVTAGLLTIRQMLRIKGNLQIQPTGWHRTSGLGKFIIICPAVPRSAKTSALADYCILRRLPEVLSAKNISLILPLLALSLPSMLPFLWTETINSEQYKLQIVSGS